MVTKIATRGFANLSKTFSRGKKTALGENILQRMLGSPAIGFGARPAYPLPASRSLLSHGTQKLFYRHCLQLWLVLPRLPLATIFGNRSNKAMTFFGRTCPSIPSPITRSLRSWFYTRDPSKFPCLVLNLVRPNALAQPFPAVSCDSLAVTRATLLDCDPFITYADLTKAFRQIVFVEDPDLIHCFYFDGYYSASDGYSFGQLLARLGSP